MAKATIDAGICGFTTDITAAEQDDGMVMLEVSSTCPHIMKAFSDLHEVEPCSQIGFFGGTVPSILQAHYSCPHAACPVFSGAVKAVEVAAGLALPKDASIRVER